MDALETAEDLVAEQHESTVEGGASWTNENVVEEEADESLESSEKGM